MLRQHSTTGVQVYRYGYIIIRCHSTHDRQQPGLALDSITQQPRYKTHAGIYMADRHSRDDDQTCGLAGPRIYMADRHSRDDDQTCGLAGPRRRAVAAPLSYAEQRRSTRSRPVDECASRSSAPVLHGSTRPHRYRASYALAQVCCAVHTCIVKPYCCATSPVRCDRASE